MEFGVTFISDDLVSEVLLEEGMGDKIHMSVEDRLLEVWFHLLLWPMLEDGPNFSHVMTLRQNPARKVSSSSFTCDLYSKLFLT